MLGYRISTIARLLGVSDDTIRRWIDEQLIKAISTGGPQRVDGVSVADFLLHNPKIHKMQVGNYNQSIRNSLLGLIVGITEDRVVTQVELQCGPYRVVSVITTEAAKKLQLEIGKVAAAQIKATNISVQVPKEDEL